MKLFSKIMLGFAAVLAIFISVAAIIYMQLNTAKENVNDSNHQILFFQQLAEVHNNLALQGAEIRGYLYYKNENFIQQLEGHIEKNNEIIENLVQSAIVAGDKEKFNKLKDLQREYSDVLLREITPLAKAGNDEQAKQIASTKGVALTNELNQLIKELKSDRTTRLTTATDKVNLSIKSVVKNTITATLLAIVIGLVISLYLARSISRPVRAVTVEASKIASGDLTGTGIVIQTQDEIGQLAKAFNTMLENLKELTKTLQDKSIQMAAYATELSASADNVAAGATETAVSINQVVSNVEQMNSTTSHMANVSSSAVHYADSGNQGLIQVENQMYAIEQATQITEQKIKRLSESSQRISQILELITSIAEQTNLLALNAAIESARAGEHGRGFAVVAEEVRKLAEQSARAAKEIYSLIYTVQEESQEAVKTMQQNMTQVQSGSQVVKEVAQTIGKIIESVQDLAEQIQSVDNSTEEITAAVQNVAASTEEQTATMEEVASTTQNMSGMAMDLENISKKFKLN